MSICDCNARKLGFPKVDARSYTSSVYARFAFVIVCLSFLTSNGASVFCPSFREIIRFERFGVAFFLIRASVANVG